MTKVQLRNEALELLVTHKASKKLSDAVTELLEQFVKTSRKDTVKRDKVITIDNIEYAYCNRHEVYEVITNFKKEKNDRISDECLLAITVHRDLTKQLKVLNDELMTKAINGEDVSELAKDIKNLKEIRGGRYDYEANSLQFAEVKDYNYDSKHITDEMLAQSKS